MWKAIRIAILLFVLATVAQGAWLDRRDATDWANPLIVVLYPIAADDSEVTRRHLASLTLAQFEPMSLFLREQARAHGLRIEQPLELKLAPRIQSPPPAAPRDGYMAQIIWWSLKLRSWAWWNDTYQGAGANVRLFLLFHDEQLTQRLAHSVGLEKGLVGVVNVFASESMAAENNVIIMHEMLHTLGATDKYDPATNMPRYPDGYADTQRSPLLPQQFAEIMGGRIPITSVRAQQAEGLHQVIIGELTAREINWKPR